MINNKQHFFFSYFFRILDLQVQQNQTQEETLPSSGSRLLCPSLIFYCCLLPLSLSPGSLTLVTSAGMSKSMVTSGGCELCPSEAAGNESSWKSEAWQQLPSTILFSINWLPQDANPGCDRRSVLCTCLFPAMNLSTGVEGESGNEVAMTSGSGVSLQSGRLHPDVQRLCLTRAVWPGLILTSLDGICLAGED